MPEPKTVKIAPPSWKWVGQMAKATAGDPNAIKACHGFIDELMSFVEFSQQAIVLTDELLNAIEQHNPNIDRMANTITEQADVLTAYLNSWGNSDTDKAQATPQQ